jgi:hypothetical protein
LVLIFSKNLNLFFKDNGISFKSSFEKRWFQSLNSNPNT